MNAVSIRGDWVGRVIDGRFLLLEWLGGSGTCGSFLTELDGPGSQKATLKLFSVPAQAEERLSTWKAIGELSHVHLVRIRHFGSAEVDGIGLVYVVTEFADEVLSQIIPERPLTVDEAREMLGAVLDALSYLHSKGYVHGHLRPSNVMVIENEVRLSADSLVAAGEPAFELESSDVHNAPETATGPMAPPADIWSLGVTTVEALTQQLPVWDSAGGVEPVVPASLPKPFDGIAHACLRVDPLERCSLSDVRALLDGKPKPVLLKSEPVTDPPRMISAEGPPSPRVPLVPLIAGLVLLVAIIVGLAMRNHKTQTVPPLQSETTQQAPSAEPESKTPSPPLSTTESAKGEVLNRDVPEVSPRASDTIQGKVSVAVRVTVDPTGAVTDAEFASHGPSDYFARIAMESARKWTFKPPLTNGRAAASTWMLRFAFRRGGTDVTPVETNP